METILLIGPWLGEDKYELQWIEIVKNKIKDLSYDRIVIGCRSGNEYKYKDLKYSKILNINNTGIQTQNLLNGNIPKFELTSTDPNKKIIQLNPESEYFEIYNRDNSVIHILWPTIRSKMFIDTFEIWKQNCKDFSKIKLYVAVDNKEDADILKNFESVIIVDNPKPGVTFPSHVLAKNLQAKDEDIVILASDDFYPCKYWDELILKQFKLFDGCLIVNDKHILEYEPNKKIDIVAIPIMSYKTLKVLNFIIYHPSYNHLCSDKELFDILEDLNLIRDISRSNPEIYIEHRHWSVGRRQPDHSDIQHKQKFEEDLINYNIRQYLPIKQKLNIMENKKSPLYIYHNLGLGDHIICNGFVRKLIECEEECYLFCKKHNLESVKFMYRDLNKMKFIVGDDNIPCGMMRNPCLRFKVMGVNGSNPWPWIQGGVQPDGEDNMIKMFARQGNIDFNERWNSFYFIRDYNREEELFKKFNLSDHEKYIFIHDDVDRNFNINYKLITSQLKQIKPIKNITPIIFDYCKILEHAEEIHCMDSSFRILCEHLNVTDKLYYHQYSKNSNDWGLPLSKKKWEIL